MDWTRDGRLVIATWGGSDQRLGEVYIVDHVTGKTEPGHGDVQEGRRAGCGNRWAWPWSTAPSTCRRSTSSPSCATPTATRWPTSYRTVATWPFGGNFHEFAFGLLYKDGQLLPEPVGRDQPRRRHHRPAAGGEPRHEHRGQPAHRQGHLRRRRPAHARTASAGARTASCSSPTTRAAGCPSSKLVHDRAGPLLQPLHQSGRPVRRQPGHPAGAVAAAERDRQLAEHAGAAQERAVPRADADRRRHLRRAAAGVPGEGARRVPGRGVPAHAGPGGRHQPGHRSARTARSTSAASARRATGASTASSGTACRSSPRTAPTRST